jgi:hypothetical protein
MTMHKQCIVMREMHATAGRLTPATATIPGSRP